MLMDSWERRGSHSERSQTDKACLDSRAGTGERTGERESLQHVKDKCGSDGRRVTEGGRGRKMNVGREQGETDRVEMDKVRWEERWEQSREGRGREEGGKKGRQPDK